RVSSFVVRPVERAFALVVDEVEAELGHRGLQRAFRAVPYGVVADAPLGPIRELDDHVVEAERTINAEQQAADAAGLGRDVALRAGYVRVVLRERADAQQPVQGPGGLVAVHFAEFREAQRQISIAAKL